MRAKITYIARSEHGPVKIGCSVDPVVRVRQLAYESKGQCKIVATIPGVEWERRLHVLFVESRIRGEWFEPSPFMDSVIQGIATGTFDLEKLPPIQRLPRGFRSKGPARSRGISMFKPHANSGSRRPITIKTRIAGEDVRLRFLTLDQALAEAHIRQAA